MPGRATFTIVTSTSSMKVPRQTVSSGSHLRTRPVAGTLLAPSVDRIAGPAGGGGGEGEDGSMPVP